MTRFLSCPLTPAQVDGQAALGGCVTWGPVAEQVWRSLAGQAVTLVADSAATYPVTVVAYDDARRELTVRIDPAIFCAVEADGATWHHLLTIGEVEDPHRAPAVVVVPCPEHP